MIAKVFDSAVANSSRVTDFENWYRATTPVLATRGSVAASRPPRSALSCASWPERNADRAARPSAALTRCATLLRAVPEFVSPPAQPRLLYTPARQVLGVPLAAVAVVIAAMALLSAMALVAAARPEQLREDQA